MNVKYFAALAVSALTIGATHAATIYTSEATFVADVGNASATLPALLGSTSAFTAAPFDFASDPGQTFAIDTSQYGKAIDPGDGNLLLSGYESHELQSAITLYAFGFKIFQPSNSSPVTGGTTGVACYFTCDQGPYAVSLYNGATLVDSFSFTPAYDTVEFHGYAGSAAFNRIRIEDTLKTIDDEYFATYRYGTTPVPEPAAAWLLIAGLLGLGAVARRRF